MIQVGLPNQLIGVPPSAEITILNNPGLAAYRLRDQTTAEFAIGATQGRNIAANVIFLNALRLMPEINCESNNVNAMFMTTVTKTKEIVLRNDLIYTGSLNNRL
jgi:hypothetical protein